MKEFAAAEGKRAHRALASARELVGTDPDSSASRAYYAAFHALTAVFALRGRTFSKHSSVRAALHRELVLPGLLENGRGRDYDFLRDLRETGDYGGLDEVSSGGAVKATERAACFLEALTQMYLELSGEAGDT